MDVDALLDGMGTGKIGGVGLDLYEEDDMRYDSVPESALSQHALAALHSAPNVLITSSQGFLTEESLQYIAATTLGNLYRYFSGGELRNEITGQTAAAVG